MKNIENKIANPKRLVEAAPGKFVGYQPDNLACCVTSDLIKVGPDLYKFVPRVCESWVRLGPGIVKKLGLGIEYRSLLRLIVAGFVLGQKATQSCWQFSIASYNSHLEQVRNDPEFWDENHPDKNLQRFKAAAL